MVGPWLRHAAPNKQRNNTHVETKLSAHGHPFDDQEGAHGNMQSRSILSLSCCRTVAVELFVLWSSVCRFLSSMMALMAAAVRTNAKASVAPNPANGDTTFHHDKHA
jgi:hypothetical protein